MHQSIGATAAGRRTIVPARRGRPTERQDGGIAGALRASIQLERLARSCGEGLAERDPNGVRRAIGLALDALEAIEAGLAVEFPPIDPGQPPEPTPSRRRLTADNLPLPHPGPIAREEASGSESRTAASRSSR